MLEKQNSIFKIELNRPNFERLLENHMIEMIDHKKQSRTVVAFCGSPQLASTIQEFKLTNDAIVRTAGYKYHGMEFIAESYGGVKSPEQAEPNVSETDESRNSRRNTKFHGMADSSYLMDDLAGLYDSEDDDNLDVSVEENNGQETTLKRDSGPSRRSSNVVRFL